MTNDETRACDRQARPPVVCRWARLAGFILSILFPLLVTACGSSSPSLTLHPASHGKPFSATFTRAFWSPDQAGEDQVILLNDPIDQTSETAVGDPLLPLTIPPIRHVLVLHLQWHSSTIRTDTPASTNAVLNWYVSGGGFPGLIHYTGSGSVTIVPHGNSATVEVRHGTLRLADKSGPLQDPLGSFTVDGTIDAINNPGEFKQAMNGLDTSQSESDRNH